MLKTPFLRLTAAGFLVVAAAAFAPAGRDDATPPDLCALATQLNEDALTQVCGDVRYLGHGTFNELNLIPSTWNVLLAINDSAQGREELAKRRHFFEYDAVVVSVRTDSAGALDMVLRTAAAVSRLRERHSDAYRFMTAMTVFPTAPSMAGTPFKNRFDKIFISFDRTPKDIAAGTTLDGLYVQDGDLKLYSNYAIISIDEATIMGDSTRAGSRAIYGRPTAQENYRAYMADGFLYTLMHEMTHRYIDYTNSTSRLSAAIYAGRRSKGATDAEEIVANETALPFVEAEMSPEMRRHVMEQNTILARNQGVRSRLAEWGGLASRSGSRLVVPD
jgi:hypothetical protein